MTGTTPNILPITAPESLVDLLDSNEKTARLSPDDDDDDDDDL
jgi:hypothetical protein